MVTLIFVLIMPIISLYMGAYTIDEKIPRNIIFREIIIKEQFRRLFYYKNKKFRNSMLNVAFLAQLVSFILLILDVIFLVYTYMNSYYKNFVYIRKWGRISYIVLAITAIYMLLIYFLNWVNKKKVKKK